MNQYPLCAAIDEIGRKFFPARMANLFLTFAISIPLLANFLWSQSVSAAPVTGAGEVSSIILGQAAVPLNGPWRFHEGDNPAWADPNFNDSEWERVDLTAPDGSHDADVGLSGYVDGWGGRGHRGIGGYGWYRLHLHISSPGDQTLSIAGPPAVDSAYQIFWNAQLLGGIGNFGKAPPRVFSIQPRIFRNTQPASTTKSSTDVLAVRVWMAPWDLADPQGGGIRIAPTLGTSFAVEKIYQSEWMETLRGYVVEVIEALGFACLCLGAWLLARFDRHPQRYRWLYAALLLTGAYRANQAIFFWGQFETVPAFELISQALLYPLALAAWTMAWTRLLGVKKSRLSKVLGGVTALYLVVTLVQYGLFHGVAHPPVTASLQVLATCCRLFYLVYTCWLLFKSLLSNSRYRWLLSGVLLLVSIGQFAPELSAIGLPGTWFPFGTGVSRAQFAYAFFFLIAALSSSLRLKDIATNRRNKEDATLREPA